MAGRVTKDQVNRAFALFCKTFGLRLATSYTDKGAFALDNYHGYLIVQLSEHGGESHPFGNTRYSPREFVDALHFAVEVERYREAQAGYRNPPRRGRGERRHPGPTARVDMSDKAYRGYLIRTNAMSGTMWIEKDGFTIATVPPSQSWEYARRVIDALHGD